MSARLQDVLDLKRDGEECRNGLEYSGSIRFNNRKGGLFLESLLKVI